MGFGMDFKPQLLHFLVVINNNRNKNKFNSKYKNIIHKNMRNKDILSLI